MLHRVFQRREMKNSLSLVLSLSSLNEQNEMEVTCQPRVREYLKVFFSPRLNDHLSGIHEKIKKLKLKCFEKELNIL